MSHNGGEKTGNENTKQCVMTETGPRLEMFECKRQRLAFEERVP